MRFNEKMLRTRRKMKRVSKIIEDPFGRSLEFETSSARAIYANVETAKKRDEAPGVTATFYAR